MLAADHSTVNFHYWIYTTRQHYNLNKSCPFYTLFTVQPPSFDTGSLANDRGRTTGTIYIIQIKSTSIRPAMRRCGASQTGGVDSASPLTGSRRVHASLGSTIAGRTEIKGNQSAPKLIFDNFTTNGLGLHSAGFIAAH